MPDNRIVFDLDELDAELNAEVQRLLLEISNELINQIKREVPVGATGDLQRSFQIFAQEDGKIVLGSRLSYALAVQEGRGPHTPDFEQIRLWARRKLGDESAVLLSWLIVLGVLCRWKRACEGKAPLLLLHPVIRGYPYPVP